MGIQNWSDNIVLVNLENEPQMSEELRTVTEVACEQGNCDVVVDFTDIKLVTSSNIASLLRLRQVLKDVGHRLVLSGVNQRLAGVFTVAGVEQLFEFADDHFTALAGLQMQTGG